MSETVHDFFGPYGGRFVAEALRPVLDEVAEAFVAATGDPAFKAELAHIQKTYIGRPTPLLFAENATRVLGGARIYIKLEGLAHTGAHKINNAIGQALLAKRMGKRRILAETGAGQHGIATAAACAKLGLECQVYMGEIDVARQRPNVFGMEMYGAKVTSVSKGQRGLKDAVNAAIRDWVGSQADTHYIIGSAVGPAPFPDMVRYFQSVIGREAGEQAAAEQLDVAAMVACVGGGSNASGFFSPFYDRPRPRLVAVEGGGRGTAPGEHAARMNGAGRVSVAQGYKSRFLVDDDGQTMPTHSISAGLDYPGIGPEIAHQGECGRVEFTRASDDEALAAVRFFARHEGVLFALESAHAGAAAMKLAREYGPDRAILVNMSGRGDKDLFITARALDGERWLAFLRREAGVENDPTTIKESEVAHA